MSDTIADYLAQHPKMSGVLFTLVLLLTQAGAAMASAGTGYPGP